MPSSRCDGAEHLRGPTPPGARRPREAHHPRAGTPVGEPDLRGLAGARRPNPNARPPVEIAIVGKYTELPDAYISVSEALKHAALHHRVDVKVRWIRSEHLERLEPEQVADELKGVAGVLVPGGFGYRGVEGKIRAIRWARVNGVPFLGLCLGLQCAVIEFAREVLGTEDANPASSTSSRPTR